MIGLIHDHLMTACALATTTTPLSTFAILEIVLNSVQVCVVILVPFVQITNGILVQMSQKLVFIMHLAIRDHARHYY